MESGTDQTPSDSLVTSDDELNKGKTPQAGAHDYSEPAESATTLSTPPVEPFASDNLGDTVIHLDLVRKRGLKIEICFTIFNRASHVVMTMRLHRNQWSRAYPQILMIPATPLNLMLL